MRSAKADLCPCVHVVVLSSGEQEKNQREYGHLQAITAEIQNHCGHSVDVYSNGVCKKPKLEQTTTTTSDAIDTVADDGGAINDDDAVQWLSVKCAASQTAGLILCWPLNDFVKLPLQQGEHIVRQRHHVLVLHPATTIRIAPQVNMPLSQPLSSSTTGKRKHVPAPADSHFQTILNGMAPSKVLDLREAEFSWSRVAQFVNQALKIPQLHYVDDVGGAKPNGSSAKK